MLALVPPSMSDAAWARPAIGRSKTGAPSLPVPSTAAALLDRLLHHALVVVTSGETWRLKEARARGRQRPTNGSILGITTR